MELELESFSNIIKKATEHYDNQNLKYKYIQNNTFKKKELDATKNEIVFTFDDHDETYKYEYLGYNDYKNNIWIWAWVLADFDDYETKECKYLLNYGLKLEPKSTTTDQLLFKGILVNSRIKIVEDIQQEVNLSLYSYLLKNRIKFIFKNKIYEDISSSNKIINEDDDNYIIQYILIK